MDAFLSIGIVGVFLSFVVQAIKVKYGTESATTKGLTIGLSIVLGSAIWFLQGTVIWAAILGVLSVASAVYAFLWK
jgi:hypothetical protein